MFRDFRLYLDDILEAINQIRTYLADQLYGMWFKTN